MIERIENNDCRNILPSLDTESLDCVFTDPPFNINLTPQRETHGKIDNDALSPEEFEDLMCVVFGECFRVLKNNSVAWVCCNWQCYHILFPILVRCGFTVENCIVWSKNNFGLGWHFRPQHEFILVAFKGTPPVPEHAISNVWNVPRLNQTIHPTEKPIDLVQLALWQYNKPGDVILDPFAGSFSTCVAAKLLGMGYIGIEKMESHFQTGKKRLDDNVLEVKNAKGKKVERNETHPALELL